MQIRLAPTPRALRIDFSPAIQRRAIDNGSLGRHVRSNRYWCGLHSFPRVKSRHSPIVTRNIDKIVSVGNTFEFSQVKKKNLYASLEPPRVCRHQTSYHTHAHLSPPPCPQEPWLLSSLPSSHTHFISSLTTSQRPGREGKQVFSLLLESLAKKLCEQQSALQNKRSMFI